MDFERDWNVDAAADRQQAPDPELAALAARVKAAHHAQPGTMHTIAPNAEGVVVLPAGTDINQIEVDGRNLIVTLPDGTQMVILDGAVVMPHIVVGDVEIPAVNLAALLIGEEPQPAAGPARSSGGNFLAADGAIGDPFALGDLLPPTELQFTQPQEREILPIAPEEDHEPEVTIVTPNQPAGATDATADVSEAGLPARGEEPAGTAAASDSEITNGTIRITAEDGLASVTINNVAITTVGQTVTTPLGVLTVTSITDNAIGYSYVLSDNVVGTPPAEIFTVVVTDRTGDHATATLTISIADDAPQAHNDTDLVAAGTYGPETGNVVTGAGTTSGAAGADVSGADGFAPTGAVVGVAAGANGSALDSAATVGHAIQGQYGVLTLNGDGSYSYVRSEGTPGGVSDSFTYTIKDADGDLSPATLTVNIGDSGAIITSIPTSGAGTVVDEAGLGIENRPGESLGSDAPATIETTNGTITYVAPDMPATVTINGVTITGVGQQITGSSGTLTITGIESGSINYSYTVTDNTSGDDVTDKFTVVVTDVDGDASPPGTLVITIKDDVPTAHDDAVQQTAENAPVVINAFTNDVFGADGVDIHNTATPKVTIVSGPTVGSVSYDAGTGLFTFTPAAGQEGTASFVYQIEDGDGDKSQATVTVTLLPDSTPTILVVEGSDTVVDEAALNPNGSNAASTAETATGALLVTTGNDTVGSLIVNNVDVTNGGVIKGAFGTLTITGSPAEGYAYSYTLETHTSGTNTHDDFAITVTDSDGDPAATTLTIAIVDDKPQALPDTDSVAAGSFAAETGNVITGAGTTSGATGADVLGADGAGAHVTFGGSIVNGVFVPASGQPVAAGGSAVIHGQYGDLTLFSNGEYSYARATETPGGVDDKFVYVLADSDGSTSPATLTISIGDSQPTVTVPAAGGETTTVFEAGLPARPGESEGSGEQAAPGANGDTRESVSGTVNFHSSDGIQSLTVGGVALDPALFPQTVVNDATGTLVITGGSYDEVTGDGSFSYTYTLKDNTSGTNTSVGFGIVLTDNDGDPAPGTLTINIVDDKPHALPDTDTVPAGSFAAETGNVITGVGATSGAAGVDVLGADSVGAHVTFGGSIVNGVLVPGSGQPVASGGSSVIHGQYGDLTLFSNGDYSYTRATETPGGVDDKFVYVLADGDGSTSPTTLTISIADSQPTVTAPAAGGETTTVYEAGLPARAGETEGSGEQAAPGANGDTRESVSGTVNFHSGDGIQSLTVGGVALDPALFPQTVVNDATGTLVITGGSYDEVTGDGSFSYTYTLKDNTSGDNSSVSFGIVLTDNDGDPAPGTLTINIVDDQPHAVDDSGYVAPEDTPITIDALHNDIFGADGVDIDNNPSVKVTILTGPQHGSASYDATTGLFTYSPNSVTTSTPDSFTYQIVDGDGDPSTATVSILLTPDAVPSILSAPAVTVDEDGLSGANADAGRAGEVTSTGSATANGQIVVDFFHDVPAQADALASIKLLDSDALDGQLKTLSGANVTFVRDSGGDLVGSSAGGEVIRIHITSATVGTGSDATKVTYGYEVTLSQPVQHAVAGSEDSDLLSGIGFQVTDTDNSTTTGSFSVNVTDDLPVALNYVSGLTFAEGSGAHDVGDAVTLLGIHGGADGLQGTLQQIQFTNQGSTGGTLSINGAGHLIYTSPAHVTSSTTALESFSYTVTDRDGDPVTKTVSFSVSDTGISGVSASNLLVDEDSLAGGLAGGPGDDAAVTSGHLNFTLGADALKSITLSATTGLTKLDGVTPVSTSWDASTNTLTGYGVNAADVVFTIKLTNITATGADYNMVLNQPVLHPGHDDPGTAGVQTSFEDNLPFTVNVSLLDADDSPGSTSFQVGVDDSSPRASDYISGQTFAEGSGAHDIGIATSLLGIAGGADGLQGTPQQIQFTNQGSTGGTLAINGAGHLIYTAPASVSSATTITETFSYTVTDKDGDSVTKVVTFGVSDTGVGPVSADNASVDEDNLANGVPGGPGDLTTPVPTGHIGFSLGADAFQSITLSTGATGLTKLDGTVINTVWNGADTLIGYGGANQSDVVFTIKLTNITSTGADYTVTLNQPIQHPLTDNPGTGTVETAFEDNQILAVNVSVKDADNSENHTTFNVTINDDSPVAAVAPVAGAALSIDETPGVDADANDVAGSLSVFAGLGNVGVDPNMPVAYAQKTGLLSSTGSATGADGGTVALSLSLSEQGIDSGLSTTEGGHIFLFKEGNLIVGRVGNANGAAAFAIAVNANGDVQLAQYLSIQHLNTASSDESVSIATNALLATVTVTDGDHDVASASTAIGNLISFQDDAPTAIAPQSIVVQNSAIAPTVTAWLDSDHNVVNNYGADGGTVRFLASLDGANSGLTSNFSAVFYDVLNDQTLVGYTEDPVTHVQTTIFTITLDPANGEYSVDMNGKLDSITTVAFNPINNNFVGGNNSWAGFIPTNETVGSPIDNNSKDLLLTPEEGGADSGTINSTANTGGVSGGASVGGSETFRVDFVTDLRGNPADGAGNYNTAANRDHVFDGHYIVNGASALFKSSGGSTVNIAAFDDPDGNTAVGDGVKDHINGVTISYLGVASSLIIPTTTPTNYTVNGHQFGVTLQADGSVNISGVTGASGSSLQGTTIAVFTSSGYNSVEYHYVSGDTFQIGGFSASTLTNQPVPFTVPIQIVDGDGDAKPATLSVTANPVAPIALDLNGDGVHYLGLNAGVTHDYGNGVVSTAWVAADDGLLAVQNPDGSLKIVFSTQAGETDLQGLAKVYDSNHDGVLDVHDAAFSSFGVWQDANSDGIVEAGEFKTLSAAGIVSLDLNSNGQTGVAAGGDVQIYGQTSYTTADGQTHVAADVAFQTISVTTSAVQQADVERAQQAGFNQALLAASLVAAVGAAETASEPQPAPATTDKAPTVTEVAPASTGTAEPATTESDAKSLAPTDEQTHQAERPVQQTTHGGEEQAPDHVTLSDHGDAPTPATADIAQADQPNLGDHQGLLAQSISLPAFDGNGAALAVAHEVVSGAVAQVVTEALGANGGPNIDALLAALPGGDHAPMLFNPVAGEALDSGHMAAVAAGVFDAAMAMHEAMAVAHG